MKSLFAFVLASSLAVTSHAHASPADDIRDQVTAALPPNLGVAHVYAPASLTKVDSVEIPAEIRIGRPSIKVISRGHVVWVPVAIGTVADVAVATRTLAPGEIVVEGDFALDSRAADGGPAAPAASLVGATITHAIANGSTIASRDVTLPPPLPRGTQVAIELHRGSVRISGTGTLELSARPGQPASVRLAFTKTVVHGVLRAPATVVVGD